jgi:hypothetical protein
VSDLANRLVTAAAKGLLQADAVHAESFGYGAYQTWDELSEEERQEYLDQGRYAAPRMLRELAQAGALLEEFGGDMPAACEALAEVIEKGERA